MISLAVASNESVVCHDSRTLRSTKDHRLLLGNHIFRGGRTWYTFPFFI
jgi:hypothetical protein